jgi:hypothetical protein
MRAGLASVVNALSRHRHALLFGMLFATISVGPLLSFTGGEGSVLNVCLGLTLLASALIPMRDEVARRAFLVFVVAAILVGLAPIRSRLGEPGPATLAMWSAIAFFNAARALRYAMSTRSVDMQHMLAALNAYLLVGVFLGAVWVVVERMSPGSLLLGGQPMKAMALPDGIYFSFVTLATLGYGDITPVSPIARGLAVFEAVFGQLYLAVLVARLVGLRGAGETRDAPP